MFIFRLLIVNRQHRRRQRYHEIHLGMKFEYAIDEERGMNFLDLEILHNENVIE